MKKFKLFILGMTTLLSMILAFTSCENSPQTSDQRQNKLQEELAQQAFDQVNLPDMKNFTQKKQAKMIIEKCDQAGLIRYAYVKNEMNGKFRFISKVIGYGLPYSTQFTSPEKTEHPYGGVWYNIPQADPNGLFMPPSANATWVLTIDPTNGDIDLSYMEDNVDIFAKPLREDLVEGFNPLAKDSTKIKNTLNL